VRILNNETKSQGKDHEIIISQQTNIII